MLPDFLSISSRIPKKLSGAALHEQVIETLRLDQSRPECYIYFTAMTVAKATMTPIQEISAKLRGKTLTVPNLKPMFSQWPYRVSPHLEELQKTVEAKLQEWIPDEQVRQNARDIDLAMFSAA